jgi:hypothetical protein
VFRLSFAPVNVLGVELALLVAVGEADVEQAASMIATLSMSNSKVDFLFIGIS